MLLRTIPLLRVKVLLHPSVLMFNGRKTMVKQIRDAFIGVRVPQNLKRLVRDFLERDAHLNESDFVREAIREKIRRDAPDFYASIFKEVRE